MVDTHDASARSCESTPWPQEAAPHGSGDVNPLRPIDSNVRSHDIRRRHRSTKSYGTLQESAGRPKPYSCDRGSMVDIIVEAGGGKCEPAPSGVNPCHRQYSRPEYDNEIRRSGTRFNRIGSTKDSIAGGGCSPDTKDQGIARCKSRRDSEAAIGDCFKSADGVVDGQRTLPLSDDEASTKKTAAVIRSGRGSRPVLDWWQSQGVVCIPKSKDAEAVGIPRDQPSLGAWNSPSPRVSKPADSGATAAWSQSQLDSLRVAQIRTVPYTNDFWGAVAAKVDGRGAQECQLKWFEHCATPQHPRKKAGGKALGVQRASESATASTASSPWDVRHETDDPPVRVNNSSTRLDCDDLFQATPMRGCGQLAVKNYRWASSPKTPSTPAGPEALSIDTFAGSSPMDGRADYKRGVSRAYVRAISKKMRKACDASGVSDRRAVVKERFSRKQPCAGMSRISDTAATSRGQIVKASISTTGSVSVASAATTDEDEWLEFSEMCEDDT